MCDRRCVLQTQPDAGLLLGCPLVTQAWLTNPVSTRYSGPLAVRFSTPCRLHHSLLHERHRRQCSSQLAMQQQSGGLKVTTIITSGIMAIAFVIATVFFSLPSDNSSSSSNLYGKQDSVKIQEGGRTVTRGMLTSLLPGEIQRKLAAVPVFYLREPSGIMSTAYNIFLKSTAQTLYVSVSAPCCSMCMYLAASIISA